MVDKKYETQKQGDKKKDITSFRCEKTGHYSNECFRKNFLSQVKKVLTSCLWMMTVLLNTSKFLIKTIKSRERWKKDQEWGRRKRQFYWTWRRDSKKQAMTTMTTLRKLKTHKRRSKAIWWWGTLCAIYRKKWVYHPAGYLPIVCQPWMCSVMSRCWPMYVRRRDTWSNIVMVAPCLWQRKEV